MPANQRHQTTQSPLSPASKATAKYTNKDGSKFITVPKTSPLNSPSEESPTMAQTNTKSSAPPADTPAGVNRKKQKRREKQAAKLAAAQTVAIANGVNGNSSGPGNAKGHARAQFGGQFHEEELDDTDEEGDMGSYENGSSSANGYTQDTSKGSKKKKKAQRGNRDTSSSRSQIPPPPPPPPPESSANPRPGMAKEKIWNTSSQEERERIKEFWLSLGEDERKSLVKVEKDAVLKKMKEQQKHSCSCTVCGRKRLAIEEELEVLYDAYYEELEQYANNRQGDPPLMRNSRRLGAMSGFHAPDQPPTPFHPSRGRIENPGEEDLDEGLDEDVEEEYSEDDDIDEYSEDEPPPERSHADDFFNFGQSLTVKGGILTVADDLLKNDGKKFIEMMEQLAERRMQREEDAERQFANGAHFPPNGGGIPNHHHSHAGHNHPPPQPDEEYEDEEEEDEDDYDEDDEDYDDEEMDSMTEEQRMEEGRRMFQIFAARMFEQRVLSAYKEKVAKERQTKLFEELDEEDQAETKRREKKAKEAQKKKEKAQLKKQAQAEEKAKREAEEAWKAAAQRAIEEKKAEEARLRQEEKRKKREAAKKAEEEERLKKEAEKQKRLQELRERQAETERKQREAKEREKREKEEARLKALEAKEAKEREARERKERMDNERKEKEAKAKEAQKQAERQKKLDEQAALVEREEARKKAATHAVTPAPPQQPAKRLPQQPVSIPIPPGLQPHPIHSPQVQVAMPILPKAPTPVRPRTVSQQHEPSNVSIPQTPQYGTGHSQDTSPAPTTPQQSSPSGNNKPYLYHPQATIPMHAALRGSPGPMHQNLPAGMHPMPMNGFQPVPPMMNQMHTGPRIPFDAPMFAHQQPVNNQYRPPPPGIPLHTPQPPMPQGRGFNYGPPGFSQHPTGPISNILHSFSPSKDNASAQSHSRNASGSFENGLLAGMMNAQPIAKPTPIGRPSSVVHGQRPESHRSESKDVEEVTRHFGSSSLLEESDVLLTTNGTGRRSSVAPSMSRGGFSNSGAPFVDQPMYGSWPNQPQFGGSSLPGSQAWGNHIQPSLGGWDNPMSSVFNNINNSVHRAGHPRSVNLRLALCRAHHNLMSRSSDGYIEMPLMFDQVQKLLPEEMLNEKELLEMCETEGTPNNGGGFFDIKTIDNDNYIKYTPDEGGRRTLGAPGEIGSPVTGGGNAHFGGRGGNFGPPGGF